ncbi:DUF6541 family protein [Amycolatopsis sp. YIM 10]|uniref:DUF6541 family protein n=1 Tax=Amycolatopsis sp. YIM 10 TaxID=2653857 RepID=UPI0012AA87CE|nr:DUF6541 family protein [Amycolatopsis sp. YIM 10]QFU85464.1 hypothetical protein YIM_01155 [Amycolatopsis sp. YIM 10]
MPISTSGWSTLWPVCAFLLVLGAPGLLVGAAAGLRGWRLAGLAPLLGYAVGGVFGPLLPLIGLPFNGFSFVACTLLLTAVAAGTRRFRGDVIHERVWTPRAHAGVAACLLLAAGISAYAVFSGLGGINAIPQGFDAPFHANGIRYIAETGDSGLFGLGSLHWYDDGLFYPNGYHLPAALVFQLTGATVPAVLNAHTMLSGGLLALSVVTMVRHFGGRAVLAGASALTAVGATMVTYGAWSSPLLPYTLAVALTPLIVVAGHRYLRRPAFDTGLVLAAGAVALLAIHSSALFGGLLFVVPLLVQRWRTLGRDLAALLPILLGGGVLALPHLLGALHLAGNFTYTGWAANTTPTQAVGELLLFSHNSLDPQLLLAGAVVLGLIGFRRLGELRWIAGSAALFGVLYLVVATSDHPLVMAISRPWWDDKFRLVAMAGLGMCVLAGHGIAEVQRVLREVGGRVAPRVAGALAAVLALGGFLVLSQGAYLRNNADYVALTWGNTARKPEAVVVVTPNEAAAMLELGKRAKPGEWAMNDWFDGSVWTYAIGGVRTIIAHDERAGRQADTELLTQHFAEYGTNAAVRDAVGRRNLHWVLVTAKSGEANATRRSPGMAALEGLPFLEVVYRNPDATLYRILREHQPEETNVVAAPG